MPRSRQNNDRRYNRRNGTVQIQKMMQDAMRQRLEDRSVGHNTIVEKLCVIAESGAKLLHQDEEERKGERLNITSRSRFLEQNNETNSLERRR